MMKAVYGWKLAVGSFLSHSFGNSAAHAQPMYKIFKMSASRVTSVTWLRNSLGHGQKGPLPLT